jgi:cell shape-determining protein MreD
MRVWVTVVLLAATHLLLHVGFSWGRGAPDLFTLALLLASREVGPGRAATAGLVMGLLEDALSVLSFGANTLAMTLVGFAGALTRDVFVGDSRFFLPGYLFLGKWTRDLIHWVAVGEGLRQPFVQQVLIDGGIAGLYVALIGWFVAALTGLSGMGREA